MKYDTNEIMRLADISSAEKQAPAFNAENVLKNYEKIFNKYRKMKNNLLGEYDEKGEYKIKDEMILKKLLEMPKKFEEKDSDIVYLSAKFDTFVLNFKIVFEISPEFCNAYLYFIEVEDVLDETVKHVTLLDTILDVYSPKFKEEVFNEWKVYLEEDVYSKDDFLRSLLNKQKEDCKFSEELVEILSQLFLLRMLKALENCGDLGKKILEEYNKFLAGATAKDPSLALDNARMKMILDYIIRKNNGYEQIAKTQEGLAVLAGFVNPMKRVFSEPSIIEGLGKDKEKEKKEEKKAEKPKEASKPKAKAKAKAKGGKAYTGVDISKCFGGGKAAKKPEAKKKLMPGAYIPINEKVPVTKKPVTQNKDNTKKPQVKDSVVEKNPKPKQRIDNLYFDLGWGRIVEQFPHTNTKDSNAKDKGDGKTL